VFVMAAQYRDSNLLMALHITIFFLIRSNFMCQKQSYLEILLNVEDSAISTIGIVSQILNNGLLKIPNFNYRYHHHPFLTD